MELLGEDAVTFVFMTPILWAFQWIRCSKLSFSEGSTIRIFRQPNWSVGVGAQVSPEDISLVELGQTAAALTSSGGGGKSSSSISREAARRDSEEEKPSAKVRPTTKESTGAKAKINVRPTTVKGKKRRKVKKVAEVKTNKAETRGAAAKTAPQQIGNPSTSISNIEHILASKRLKPIGQKRSHSKTRVKSRKGHRAADGYADGPDSLDSGLSLCPPQPPVPTSPPQNLFLLPNFVPDPAPRLLQCPVQKTYLSVPSLPRHPLYISSSSSLPTTLERLNNEATGRQLSSSPTPQFSLSPSYF